jgi:hypothetical protein
MVEPFMVAGSASHVDVVQRVQRSPSKQRLAANLGYSRLEERRAASSETSSGANGGEA